MTTYLMDLRGFTQVTSKLGLVIFIAGIAVGRLLVGFFTKEHWIFTNILLLFGLATVFSTLLYFIDWGTAVYASSSSPASPSPRSFPSSSPSRGSPTRRCRARCSGSSRSVSRSAASSSPPSSRSWRSTLPAGGVRDLPGSGGRLLPPLWSQPEAVRPDRALRGAAHGGEGRIGGSWFKMRASSASTRARQDSRRPSSLRTGAFGNSANTTTPARGSPPSRVPHGRFRHRSRKHPEAPRRGSRPRGAGGQPS